MSFGHNMKPLSIILLAALLAGCTVNRDSNAPPPVVSAATPKTSGSIDSFRFIGPHTTMQEVTAKLGKPDRDIGSGLYVYAYRLNDGTDVLIGSGDGSGILYVRHGTEVLFQKK